MPNGAIYPNVGVIGARMIMMPQVQLRWIKVKYRARLPGGERRALRKKQVLAFRQIGVTAN